MGFNRRYEQERFEIAPGVTEVFMTGALTGSKMLRVASVVLEQGAQTPYRYHSEAEESLFVAEGSVVIRLEDHRFRLGEGDCVLVKRGQPHSVKNETSMITRIITFSPCPEISSEKVAPPTLFKDEFPSSGLFLRAQHEPYEFEPGIMRYDMVGDFLDAESSYFSELIFKSGVSTSNHYHPAHEEAMLCLSGRLNCVYGKSDDIPMAPGDMFTCEPLIRHGIFNTSGGSGRLLAMHPVLNPPPRVSVP